MTGRGIIAATLISVIWLVSSDAGEPAADTDLAAPRILYTDLVAGPVEGGEDNLGAYVSIFGTHFGADLARVRVFFGVTEVARYRYLGKSNGRADIQQLVVQPGRIGTGSLPIRVEVAERVSNTDHTFMVNEGKVLFVDNVSGNDSTAEPNNVARPWRHLQTPEYGGALGAARPGDVIVLRGRAVWRDLGASNRWVLLRHTTGSKPTGRRGTGYIAIVSYPGETVRYRPPEDSSGGIHGVGEGFEEFADWIVVSGLHIESHARSRADGAPINLQAASDHWRVVNNELGPWPAPADARNKAGGLTGNGTDVRIFGNEIHGIGGGYENHGIYLDTGARDVEIAYNHIHHVMQGNLVQSYDNLGDGNITSLSIHDNIVHDGGRYGLNIADGTQSARLWSNYVYDTAMAGIRFNVRADSKTRLLVERNTLFNVCRQSRNESGAIENTWALNAGSVVIRNNLLASPGDTCPNGYDSDGEDGALRLSGNQYSGYAVSRRDDRPINERPHFADVGARDLRLMPANLPAVTVHVGVAGF